MEPFHCNVLSTKKNMIIFLRTQIDSSLASLQKKNILYGIFKKVYYILIQKCPCYSMF